MSVPFTHATAVAPWKCDTFYSNFRSLRVYFIISNSCRVSLVLVTLLLMTFFGRYYFFGACDLVQEYDSELVSGKPTFQRCHLLLCLRSAHRKCGEGSPKSVLTISQCVVCAWGKVFGSSGPMLPGVCLAEC